MEMDKYLTSSMLTLDRAGATVSSDDIVDEEMKVESLVKNVKPVFKALSYNKGERAKVDGSDRDLKRYFLDNCDSDEVIRADIMPLEQTPDQAKNVTKIATLAVNKILQRIATGSQWPKDTMDILQSAGGSYLDFTQKGGFLANKKV